MLTIENFSSLLGGGSRISHRWSCAQCVAWLLCVVIHVADEPSKRRGELRTESMAKRISAIPEQQHALDSNLPRRLVVNLPHCIQQDPEGMSLGLERVKPLRAHDLFQSRGFRVLAHVQKSLRLRPAVFRTKPQILNHPSRHFRTQAPHPQPHSLMPEPQTLDPKPPITSSAL